MRRALVLGIVAFLLGGVGEVQGQERAVTIRGSAPADTARGAGPVPLPVALNSARRWILQETRAVATPSRPSDPIASGDQQQTHASLLVRQFGALNRIRARQRGALNTLSLKQVGVDSTAQVEQDGVGNVARITQRSFGV